MVFLFLGVSFRLVATRPFTDWDEAIYAQVSREALESHSPFSFTWKGNIGRGMPSGWYEKPPIMIWLTELSFVAFGRSELSARLWPFLFAIATIALVCFWVKRAFHSNRAMAITSVAFLLAYQYVRRASTLGLDIPVGFFILLALFAYSRINRDDRYSLLFWLAMGLGLMVKSIIGLLPVLVVLLATLLTRDLTRLRKCAFYWPGIGAFLLVTVPWHLVETIMFGYSFWYQYVVYHLWFRWSTYLEENVRPFWFYWSYLGGERTLVALLLPSLIYVGYRGFKRNTDAALLFASCFAIFFFFSSAHTKHPWYILPIYPFAAASIGVTADAVLRFLRPRAAAPILCSALILGCFAVGTKHFERPAPGVLRRRQAARDNYAIGKFLLSQPSTLRTYVFSTLDTGPAITYYANEPIFSLDPKKAEPPKPFLLIAKGGLQLASTDLVFNTPTKDVYLVR